MKRPCCREFGVLRFIISEDNKTFEVRSESRQQDKKLFKVTLGKFTSSDAEKMSKWLLNTKEWLEVKR